MPNLAEQIRETLTMFACTGTQPALIGGLAVAVKPVSLFRQPRLNLLEPGPAG